jgi:ribulose-bisphosphate carboxylase large chain
MLHYIDLKYKPKNTEILVEYYLEPRKKYSFEYCAEQIAAESSIGTWTDISTMNKRIANKLKPHVYAINKKSKTIKIAYPINLFEKGNMSQILSSIAGNIFGMKMLKNLRLEDIEFSKEIVNNFKGPRYGIQGIRTIVRQKNRPLIGTIVKPKVGLTPKQHAKVAYEAWVGGLDVVKDDENLTSMNFNFFKARIKETLKMKRLAEQKTGEKKIYMPNVTAETKEMLKRAKYVKRKNGEYVMIDVLTAGFAAVQTLRNNTNLVIHAHRAMHAALTKNHKHGISMLCLAKIFRLIGVDQIHIGTAGVGKMDGTAKEICLIEDEIEDNAISANDKAYVLDQNWYSIKPTLAVASGGLSPLSIPAVMKAMGSDIVMQFGGGCHGHPKGTLKGAKAIRQALDATMKNVSLEEYAKNHVELKEAIKKWGNKKKTTKKRKTTKKKSKKSKKTIKKTSKKSKIKKKKK